MLPSSMTEIVICSSMASAFLGCTVTGSSTACPRCSMGVMTMKMIRSTRTTSTRGVTLMSPFGPLAPPVLRLACMRLARPQEPVEDVRLDGVDVDLELLHASVEVVEDPDGRDGHEQPEGRGEQ